MAIQENGGRWYLYFAHFWHSGWSILDVTDPTNPTLQNYIEGPPNTTTKQIQVADGLVITGLEMPPDGGGPVDGPSWSRDRPYETGAYIWDVETDPTDPELVGHYETGGAGTSTRGARESRPSREARVFRHLLSANRAGVNRVRFDEQPQRYC